MVAITWTLQRFLRRIATPLLQAVAILCPLWTTVVRFAVSYGIRSGWLTDDLFKLTEQNQYRNLPTEIEARWRL